MPIRRTSASHAHAASYDACAHVVLRYHSGGSHNVSLLERHWNSWSENCGGHKRWPVVCSRGKCSRPNPSPSYSLPACYNYKSSKNCTATTLININSQTHPEPPINVELITVSIVPTPNQKILKILLPWFETVYNIHFNLEEHGATTIYISFVVYNIPHCIAICRFPIVHKCYNARIRRFASSPAASCVSSTPRAVFTHEFLRYHSGGSHYLSFLQRHQYRRYRIAAHDDKPCVATLRGNFN